MTAERMSELRAVYLGLVAEVDHHIGRLLNWLDETDQADRTLVVMTSDHGEMLGDKAMWGKDSVFDGAYHVPLIIRDPRNGRPGLRHDVLTESIDVTPTVLDWIGSDVPPAMDGRSLLPYVTGQKSAPDRDVIFLENDLGHVRNPTRFQKSLGLSLNQTGVSILRSADWKYVHLGADLPPLLFDLVADPGEQRNLAADPAHAGTLAKLAGRMIRHMTERRDRRYTGMQIGC